VLAMRNQPFVVGPARQIGLAVLTTPVRTITKDGGSRLGVGHYQPIGPC
jgi:hypothetical protein